MRASWRFQPTLALANSTSVGQRLSNTRAILEMGHVGIEASRKVGIDVGLATTTPKLVDVEKLMSYDEEELRDADEAPEAMRLR